MSNIEKVIRDQVKGYASNKNQQGGEDAYDRMVGTLNSIAHVAQSMKISDSSIPSGSTSGDVSTLVNDMVGLVEHTLNTVMDTVIAADSIVALPSNLGKAYNEPIAHQKFNF